MKRFKDAINEMYKVRNDFLILGLTGRTGSGCTKTASILQKETMKEMDLEDPFTHNYKDSEERKYQVIYNFLNYDKRWKEFVVVEGSSIILSFILEQGYEKLKEYLEKCHNTSQIVLDNLDTVLSKLKGIERIFTDGQAYPLVTENNINESLGNKNKEYYLYYTKEIKLHKQAIQNILKKHICYPQNHNADRAQLYTHLLQVWANNIRATGDPYGEGFSERNYYDIAKRIEKVVDIVKCYANNQEDKRVRICIDALRTPYEVLYLRDTYKIFQLISVDTDESARIGRLSFLSKEERESMDQMEFVNSFASPEEQFYHQDIQSCMEIADIHIYNPNVSDNKYFFLTRQLLKYVALMLHPGLITPSHLERCMQLAYNAKVNSACLSRQVGAVITGEDFSVKAVGWNDVPKGQIPCGLRDIKGFCKNRDMETYSEYERCDLEFNSYMEHLNNKISDKNLEGRMCSYCFKDIYNGYKGTKNQVFTRSLHAEENAFLQITKYGGVGIKGGFLFTTSSPCELCAKKAYQLGITNIYYIEIYSGISAKHILSFGTENNPQMHLFYGAIGNAYISLYEPRMSPKDELELLSGLDIKEEIYNKQQMDRQKTKKQQTLPNIIFDSYEISMEILNRENMISKRSVKFNVVGEPIKEITRTITWTGSQYKGTKILKPQKYEIKDSERESSPHRYTITFDDTVFPGTPIEYEIQTDLGDEKHIMETYLAHVVNNIISTLKIILRVSKDLVDQVSPKVYRGLNREIPIDEDITLNEEEEGDYMVYSITQINPSLYNTYSIEWKWKES